MSKRKSKSEDAIRREFLRKLAAIWRKIRRKRQAQQ
jgi:hypothetical protein